MAEQDTNKKWKQLQEMRRANGETPSEPEPVKEPEPPAEPLQVAPATEQPRDAEGKFAKREEAPAAAGAAAPPELEKAPAKADATPRGVEIEIDGQKITVDPLIAEAFTKAETHKKTATAAADRETLKTEIVEAVKASLPVAPARSPAELAADAALAAAQTAAALPKKPDPQLMISDPSEWQRQQDLFEEARLDAAVAKTKADTLAEIQRQQTVTQKDANERAEQQARAILAEQFYNAYPVFRGSEALVNGLLKEKFDEVLASGKLNKPLTAIEQEALKASEFADVATRATRSIVNVMNAGKRIAPPAVPPTLVSSAPAKPAPPTPAEEPRAPKERYPKGSVSALLAARKASREAASAG